MNPTSNHISGTKTGYMMAGISAYRKTGYMITGGSAYMRTEISAGEEVCLYALHILRG